MCTDWLTCARTLVTLTLRVISLMSTGASRLDRSFLCTQRKLISTIGICVEKTTQTFTVWCVR